MHLLVSAQDNVDVANWIALGHQAEYALMAHVVASALAGSCLHDNMAGLDDVGGDSHRNDAVHGDRETVIETVDHKNQSDAVGEEGIGDIVVDDEDAGREINGHDHGVEVAAGNMEAFALLV